MSMKCQEHTYVRKGIKNPSCQGHAHLLSCFLLAVTSKTLSSKEHTYSWKRENIASYQSPH